MRQACQKAGRGITARASSEPVAAGEAHDLSPWPAKRMPTTPNVFNLSGQDIPGRAVVSMPKVKLGLLAPVTL